MCWVPSVTLHLLKLYIHTFNIKSVLVATIFLTTGNEALCIAMHIVEASLEDYLLQKQDQYMLDRRLNLWP